MAQHHIPFDSTIRCDNVTYTYNYTENGTDPAETCVIPGCIDVNVTPLNDHYYNHMTTTIITPAMACNTRLRAATIGAGI